MSTGRYGRFLLIRSPPAPRHPELANFDVQEREPVHLDLIAEIVGWFDLVALQEIRDDLSGLRALRERLPSDWALLFSEASGNDERQAFLYDAPEGPTGR